MKVSTCLKLIVLGLVLIALGVGIRVGVRSWHYYTSPEQLHAMLYEQLAGALEAQVELGEVAISDEGLLCADDLSLRLPGESTPFFTCRRLLIGVDKFRLFRLRPVLERVTFVEPTLDLSYSHADHRWNVEHLRARQRPGTPGGAPPGLLREGIVLEKGAVTVRNTPLFGDAAPRRYEGLYLELQPGRSLKSWRAQGELRGGLLSGTTLNGWVNTDQQTQFSMDISAGRVLADEALWNLIPQGTAVWSGFAVRGLLACKGTISQTAGEDVRASFRVDVIKAALRVPFYPVALSDVHGTVHVTESDIILQSCNGVVAPGELDTPETDAPPAQVRVSGSSSLTDQGAVLMIEALDLPLTRKTITSIPEAGPEIWERLAPSGQARLLLTICDRPGAQADSFAAVVDLGAATLNPPESPLPLQKVSGRIVVDGRTARLNSLTGLIVQNPQGGDAAPSVASFSLDGVLDLQREATRLKLTVDNLKSDERLVRAVPGVGDEVWEMFRPEVALDVTALLTDSTGPDEMAATVLLSLHSGTARPVFLPMPLKDVCGALRVENGRVFLEGVTAVVEADGAAEGAGDNRGDAQLRGFILPESGKADVYVEAANLTLTEPLLAAVPEVGRRIWDEARPNGTVSVRGRVRYDPQRETPVRLLLDVDLQDVSALPRFLPIPIDALAGQLLLTEEQAISNDFSGVACGGQFQGAAVANFWQSVELPIYGAQLQFSQIGLQELVKAISGEQRDIEGRLTGALAIGGLAGDPHYTYGKGVVSLSDGRLWETPFFARLLNALRLSALPDGEATARGEASYALIGDTVYVHEFELTGGGLSLSGYGEVTLDGELNLTMVAVGASQKGGIPIVTPVMGWLLQVVERELVQLRVTGPIDDPKFTPTPLAKLTARLTGLPRALLSPFRTKGTAAEPEPD